MPDQSPQIKLIKNQISNNVCVNLKSVYLSAVSGPKQSQLLFSPGRDESCLLLSSMEMAIPLFNV